MIFIKASIIKGTTVLAMQYDKTTDSMCFCGGENLDELIASYSTADEYCKRDYTWAMSQLLWWMQFKPSIVTFKNWDDVKEYVENNPIMQYGSAAGHFIGKPCIKEPLQVWEYSPVPKKM